jgi:EmrB/QacA subfamily drug resistance transporter
VLAVLGLGVVIVGLDSTVLNTALPTLSRELRASSTELEWLVASYTVVFGALLLATSSLADRIGRRRALTIGLLVFGTGSALAAFATTATMVIVWRGVMGVGAALMLPATLSILTAAFPPERRAFALGVWGGLSGIGMAAGPILGGWLLEQFWWGSVFLINVPVIGLALILGYLVLPDSPAARDLQIDRWGAVLSVAGLGSLVYAIIEGPGQGWTEPSVLAAIGIFVVALVAFVRHELRTARPLLDVRLFRRPRFTGATLSLIMVFFAFAGTLYYLTQYLQFVQGYSPSEAGIRLTPIVVALMIGAPLGGAMDRRLGARVVVPVGMGVAATGLVWMSTLGAGASYPSVAVGMLALGFGLGLAMAPTTDLIQGSVPSRDVGSASGVNSASRQIGISLGVAIMGSVLTSRYSDLMASQVAGLPAQGAAAAQDSIAAALEAASRLGGPGAQSLVAVATEAFLSGMARGLLLAAVVAILGAVVAAKMLPGRAAGPAAPTIEPQVDIADEEARDRATA